MIRNARKALYGFNTTLLPKMTLRQRIICFTHCASPLFSVWKCLRIWLLLLLVFSSMPLISPSSTEELRQMVFTSWLLVLIARIEDVLGGLDVGFQALRRRKQGVRWMAPYQTMAIFHELLPTGAGGKRIGFIPTAMAESSIRERDATARSGTLERVKTMVWDQGLMYHALTISCAAIILGGFTLGIAAGNGRNTGWVLLLTHVLVPGTDWEKLFALAAPLTYAIWPPPMPARRESMDECLIESKGFSLFRPSEESKAEKWDRWVLVHELPYVAMFILWTYACFWAAL